MRLPPVQGPSVATHSPALGAELMGKNSIDDNDKKTSGKSHFIARFEVGRGPIRALLEAEFWHSEVGTALGAILVVIILLASSVFAIWTIVHAIR